MKRTFDEVSLACSRLTTNAYSTSFSYAVLFLGKQFRTPIYSIYGFVRFADEIVDSFHDFDKKQLLLEFRAETFKAIEQGISLNPILNSFQDVVRKYNIDHQLVHTFLDSMEMDLQSTEHDAASLDKYVLGSAEVVGLMCLKVFCNGDEKRYDELKAPAMSLGAAFQKVNFLRDLKADYKDLNRSYFPGVEPARFAAEQKLEIERKIDEEFRAALPGIRQLPAGSRLGVYLAYVYYRCLLRKIRSVAPSKIMESRVRISNKRKMALIVESYIRYHINYL
jgi:phytoene/squalene synthetase